MAKKPAVAKKLKPVVHEDEADLSVEAEDAAPAISEDGWEDLTPASTGVAWNPQTPGESLTGTFKELIHRVGGEESKQPGQSLGYTLTMTVGDRVRSSSIPLALALAIEAANFEEGTPIRLTYDGKGEGEKARRKFRISRPKQ